MKFNFETTSNFKINIRIWLGSTRSLFSASQKYGSHSLMNKSKLFARLLILTQNKKNSTSTIYLQLPFVIGSFARPAWPGTILNLSHYNLVMHPPPSISHSSRPEKVVFGLPRSLPSLIFINIFHMNMLSPGLSLPPSLNCRPTWNRNL